MTPRRPRWALLGILFIVSWLVRQMPELRRAWLARRATARRGAQPAQARWPFSLPGWPLAPSQPARKAAKPRRPRNAPAAPRSRSAAQGRRAPADRQTRPTRPPRGVNAGHGGARRVEVRRPSLLAGDWKSRLMAFGQSSTCVDEDRNPGRSQIRLGRAYALRAFLRWPSA